MNSTQAKKIPITDVLAKLGYSPVRKDKGGVEWVYNSPFRNEKIPSMFVNIRKNVWNDFGDRGGTIIDFIKHHENTDVKGALIFLKNLISKKNFSPNTYNKSQNLDKDNITEKQELFILDNVLPLKSASLENYLRSRAVNISIARTYLKTVQFHHAETRVKYYALGFKNNSDSYEVRNPGLKGIVGRKDLSFIKGQGRGEAIVIFEGFMDFLSYLTDKNQRYLQSDVLILNSTKLIERAKNFIQQNNYKKIYTFFDNDKTGKEAATSFSEIKKEIISCSYVYQDFKDFNEYLQNKKQLSR